MAWFYMLYSASLGRFYIGHTVLTVEERLIKHLGDHKAWTSRAKDWRITYREQHPDKASAMRRERDVKAWKKRERIQALIASNPE
jgi:putative endonuclease